ncbi:class I SAM-dependent methyltransferase [Pseudonocardia broussonetiae]|uniref:class I SAM-dependent methyltransferase n=1 Tax=Pseudonocardia broussonetiae TaxID=2736640 RepID=UPI001F03D83C|nr:methyltransferase domain-containing protein [Pseudonocardia broussonetiae]
MGTVIDRARRVGGAALDVVERTLTAAGLGESPEKLGADARRYWEQPDGDRWRADSHWRDASVFAGTDLWSETGRRHLDLLRRMARVVEHPGPRGTVLEWGCGGGANAVHLAPEATAFVGVDLSAATLEECGRQVAAVTATPFRPVLIDPAEPEAAVAALRGTVDVFTCFYVFELIVSQEYGARLLRIAADLLTDDGLALVQIKYDTGSFGTRPRRRNYRSRLASMTTYRIDEFWELAHDCGLVPHAVHLVPRNELDERYAYFLLTRAGGPRAEAAR